MPSLEETPQKKSKIPCWAVAAIVFLTLALITLICLFVAFRVTCVKNQETTKWPNIEGLDKPGQHKRTKRESSNKVVSFILDVLKRLVKFMSSEEEEEKKEKPKQVAPKELEISPEKEQRLKEIAKMFQDQMNSSVDPCQDFYQFACGNYRNGKAGSYAKFYEVAETLKERQWEALNSIDTEKVDERLRKVYSYLQKLVSDCTETEDMAEFMADVTSILEQIGGTPILDSEMPKVNPFTSALNLLKLTGIKTLLSVKRDRDIFNPQLTALYVDFPLSFLGSESELYATNVYNSLVLGNGNITDENIQRYQEDYGKIDNDEEGVIQFIVSQFAELSTDKATGESDVSIPFEDMQSMAPNVAEALLTQISAEELEDTRIFWKLNSEEVNIDLSPEGLGKFDGLLRKHWWAVQSRVVERFLREFFNADGSLVSKKDFCLHSTQPALNYAVLHLLVNTYDYGIDKLLVIRDTIESIRTIFTAALFQIDWLDPITINKALNKLNRVTPRMIAPPLVYENAAIQEYFQDLPELKGDETLLETLKAVNSMFVNKQFQELGSNSKTLFESFMVAKAFEVNAFYSPTENSINVLLGFIQPPYMDWNDPKFYLYAGTGHWVGHEFTHGFDTTGSKFDLNGRYRQWMSNESKANFQEKAKCFYEQYSQFCYRLRDGSTKCLDGELTSGETMADDGGMRFAYMAFVLETFLAGSLGVTSAHEPKLMPGFEDYSLLQLFFLSFANKMCWANELTKFNDPHPPHQARVLGTLRNMEEFSAAFNCPVGSGMNPEKKCRVW